MSPVYLIICLNNGGSRRCGIRKLSRPSSIKKTHLKFYRAKTAPVTLRWAKLTFLIMADVSKCYIFDPHYQRKAFCGPILYFCFWGGEGNWWESVIFKVFWNRTGRDLNWLFPGLAVYWAVYPARPVCVCFKCVFMPMYVSVCKHVRWMFSVPISLSSYSFVVHLSVDACGLVLPTLFVLVALLMSVHTHSPAPILHLWFLEDGWC